jgi:ribosomal protein L32
MKIEKCPICDHDKRIDKTCPLCGYNVEELENKSIKFLGDGFYFVVR